MSEFSRVPFSYEFKSLFLKRLNLQKQSCVTKISFLHLNETLKKSK